MAKKIIIKQATFALNSVKGHSVRYDAEHNDTTNATSIYVRKDAFESAGNTYPQKITVTIEEAV